MANKEFEQQQVLKAYRKGIISDELFAAQMAELGTNGSGNGTEMRTAPRSRKRPLIAVPRTSAISSRLSTST